jgi:hypothetical protein
LLFLISADAFIWSPPLDEILLEKGVIICLIKKQGLFRQVLWLLYSTDFGGGWVAGWLAICTVHSGQKMKKIICILKHFLFAEMWKNPYFRLCTWHLTMVLPSWQWTISTTLFSMEITRTPMDATSEPLTF